MASYLFRSIPPRPGFAPGAMSAAEAIAMQVHVE